MTAIASCRAPQPTPSQLKFLEQRRARIARITEAAKIEPEPAPRNPVLAIAKPSTSIKTKPKSDARLLSWVSDIEDVTTEAPNAGSPVERAMRVVAHHFGVSRVEMTSARRAQKIVLPRHIAMYVAKATTHWSLPEIGLMFGRRDHTTVLHAVRKIAALIKEDADLCREVAFLVEGLGGARDA